MGFYVVPGIILLIIGVLIAFFGYWLHAVFAFCAGFFGGLTIGCFLVSTAWSEIGWSAMIIAGVFLGIGLGVLCVMLKKLWVFIECFGCGFVLTAVLIIRFSFGSFESIQFLFSVFTDGSYALTRIVLPAALVGCIAGVAGIFLSRIWIIIFTSLWGGVFCCIGLAFLALDFTTAEIVSLLISVLGIVYQIVRTGRAGKEAAAVQTAQAPWPVWPQSSQPTPWPGQPQSSRPGQPQPSQPAPWPGQPQMGADGEAAGKDGGKERSGEQSTETVLFCTHCGNKLGENDIFCPECGKKAR